MIPILMGKINFTMTVILVRTVQNILISCTLIQSKNTGGSLKTKIIKSII